MSVYRLGYAVTMVYSSTYCQLSIGGSPQRILCRLWSSTSPSLAYICFFPFSSLPCSQQGITRSTLRASIMVVSFRFKLCYLVSFYRSFPNCVAWCSSLEWLTCWQTLSAHRPGATPSQGTASLYGTVLPAVHHLPGAGPHQGRTSSA